MWGAFKQLKEIEQERLFFRYYAIWFIFYLACSLLGQFGCAIPVDLSYIFGEGWWIPLGVITIVPMVDVSRSYTQYYAERARVPLRKSLVLMLSSSLFISLIFSVYGKLPVSICLATFLAVNIGGLMDVVIFRKARSISSKAYVRMLFSNLAATLTGGGVFYIVAYSAFLDNITKIMGVEFSNHIHMDNLLKGWLLQSAFIWISGSIMATLIGNTIEVHEGNSNPVKSP